MKTEPIVPATIEFPEGQAPWSPVYGDRYHPEAGAGAGDSARSPAQHVFLRGNGLPGRWQGRRRFAIVEIGFGLGHNFLATRQAWLDDRARCERLVYLAIDKHPPTQADLAQAHRHAEHASLSGALVDAWPAATPNLHLLDFDQGHVQLVLCWGDVATMLPQLQAEADAFYLDGFEPACNPAMWDRRVIKGLARLATPGATAAAGCNAPAVQRALVTAGFRVAAPPGVDPGSPMTTATFEPRFKPRRAPGRTAAVHRAADDERHALIIGAGLAGAHAADALVRMGWRCTVLDRCASPAGGASGNPGGLFHGTAHASDGVHARFNRAAALRAAHHYGRLIEGRGVKGQCDGLLRLHTAADCPALPADYVRPLAGTELSALAGMTLSGPAWLYAGGGWVAPADVVHALLGQASVDFRGSLAVAGIERRAGQWQAIAADGRSLASAPVLVLAGGADGLWPGAIDPWPLARVRGQVSWFDHDGGPRRPLSGAGYALSLPGGKLLCGATTADGDPDTTVRAADHAHNLARLKALTGLAPAPDVALCGRTGWRATTPDRLPIVGAVPVQAAALPAGLRLDQARLVPRVEGLFVLGGLASRGLTWAPLAAEVLAAWIDGAPMPLEGDLLDSIDPARWIVRAARRSVS